MQNLQNNLPHMVMGVVAVAAVVLLALEGTISGGEALGIIGASTGFTMGVGGTSVSNSGAAVITPATLPPPGQTLKETTTHEVAAHPTTPPAA